MKFLRFTLPLHLRLPCSIRLAPSTGASRRIAAVCASLYVLFAVYVLAGTFGRFPWKADEPYSFAIVWNAVNHDRWLIPYIGDDPFMEKPPLIFWLGALCVRLFPWLAPHEASRLAVLVCLAVTLRGFCHALKRLYAEIPQPRLSAPAWRRIWSGQRPADDRLFILYRARRGDAHAAPTALPPSPARQPA